MSTCATLMVSIAAPLHLFPFLSFFFAAIVMNILLVLAAMAAGAFGQFGLDFQNFNLPKVKVPNVKLPNAELELAGNKISLEKLFKEEWMGFKVRGILRSC